MTHEGLVAQAQKLAETVGALVTAVDKLDERTNRSERIVIGVVFGVLLSVVLSIAVGLIVWTQINTNGRLQATIDREAATREQALCPLYSLIVGSYNPGSRAEGEDRQQYEATFQAMRDAYDSLDCPGGVVPPAQPR